MWASRDYAFDDVLFSPFAAIQVKKKGTLHADSNFLAWVAGWVPDAQWVVSLWRAEKLDHDSYTELSARLKDGHDRRMANLAAVRATETALAQQRESTAAREALRKLQKPFMPYPQVVVSWMTSFDHINDRYKFLVFYGRSQTGKSRWARCIFGEDATLVVDCQHAEHPNLRHYVRGQHKAVLLDEIAGPDFVARNKNAG